MGTVPFSLHVLIPARIARSHPFADAKQECALTVWLHPRASGTEPSWESISRYVRWLLKRSRLLVKRVSGTSAIPALQLAEGT